MYQTKLFSVVSSFSVAAAAAFAFSAPNVFADFTSSSSVPDNEVAAGTVDVELVDANGTTQIAPIFTINNAMPYMTAESQTLRIKNQGTLDAAIELTATNLVSSSSNLDDVLRIVVRDSSNQILYSGQISALSIEVGNLAAGAELDWTVAIDWPDLPAVDDNQYQAAALAFEFNVSASNLVV